MREIRKLDKTQIREALAIAAKAYPIMGISSEQKLLEFEASIVAEFDQQTREWYGLFEDGKLLGNMVLYDFVTNYFGQDIKALGIGFVAVDFLHKKQKICKEMLLWYLEHALKQNYPLAILYAFKPQFYKKMGFGYGTKCFNYSTRPEAFPQTRESLQMQYLNPSDKEAVIAFYRELYLNNHGMISKKPRDVEALLKAPGVCVVGCREQNKLSALLVFRLAPNKTTDVSTDMKLELHFTTPKALKAAMNFLNSQADQVEEITISTLHRDFYYNLADIRHSDHKILREPGFHHIYDAGMGMMYRSLNPVELVLKRPCRLENMRLHFILTDTFMEKCRTDFTINWKAGKASLSKSTKADAEIRMDVADFSSWILNAVDLTTLHQYGLAEISNIAYLPALDQAFYYQQKPICLERF